MADPADSHTIIQLDDIEDMAPKFGLDRIQEARFVGNALGLTQLGMADIRMKPDQASPFTHHHREQEELYVVLAGSGTIRLDDHVQAITAGAAVRIAPGVERSLASGPEGLRVLCIGAPAVSRGENDAELTQVP